MAEGSVNTKYHRPSGFKAETKSRITLEVLQVEIAVSVKNLAGIHKYRSVHYGENLPTVFGAY